MSMDCKDCKTCAGFTSVEEMEAALRQRGIWDETL